jgi:hypothetical protein
MRPRNASPAGRANRRRGEVEAVIDGERRILCLTLGSLAELETAFAADSLAGLAERFAVHRLKAEDLIVLLAAGLRGGGNVVSDEDVAGMCVDGGLGGLVRVVGDLMVAAFGAVSDDERGDGRALPDP